MNTPFGGTLSSFAPIQSSIFIYNIQTIFLSFFQVDCPKIELTEGLKAIPPNKHSLNDKVHFECTNGNSLIGEPSVKCLPNSLWSNPIPACQDVVCPKNLTFLATSLRPKLRVQVHSYGAGGNAFFRYQGSSINHVVKILGVFDPLLPHPSWSRLVIKWSFD